jgi:hypothetical protein
VDGGAASGEGEELKEYMFSASSRPLGDDQYILGDDNFR